ncbi:uncharacterized protein LAJ45_09796 [Morchella importuna]|uniref:uncharacterized protein n=1 Tax=Morchella importuna TaxID=1174673 RepID=UPI001E8E17F9|nr:uncharacterized protein LAJ45_09796 [Morchella importuna]KAH8146106.1 hypothetical protein LAJ45_09796 [Morchella importuna]
MEHNTIIALVATASSAAIIAVSSTINAAKHWKQVSSKRKGNYEEIGTGVYQDEDGTATEESEARYSTYVQKVFILFGAALGVGFSLPIAIRSMKDMESLVYVSNWLVFVSWCFITIRAICVIQLRGKLQTFYASCQLAGVGAILLVAQLVLASMIRSDLSPWLELGLVAGRMFAAFVLIFSSLSVPRRPDVYFNGQKVDEMRSVSLFSRYTYTWAGTLLKLAFQRGRLEEHDLPVLDSKRRARELQNSFSQVAESPRLYYQIYLAHWRTVNIQWTLSLMNAFTTFAPQYIMFQLLKSLEKRSAGVDARYEAWFWLICLGLTKLVDSVIASYLYWLSYMGLMIPVRGQLSAIVFSKTMRKKDVKGMQTGKDSETTDDANDNNKTTPGANDDEDELKNMKQGTINLLAIDSSRVAEFTSFSCAFFQAIFEMFFGFSLLINIIGWKSMVAGLGVVAATTPFNVIVSKKYSAAQDNLMKVRDRKMAVISEALQGIRQIKFSALETQWENRIRAVRNDELKTLRTVFTTEACLILFWIMNPVLLSVVALSSYAIIYGTLLPSVAFTALAVFSELEFVLSVIPELTTDALDAYVSTKRIKDYLDSAEKSFKPTPSKRIAINSATIAWAADSEDQKDRFCLRDVNLEFPINGLSVISGRTGSGKSLLLAALLGEADVLSGDIEMPLPPLPEERFDAQANPGNWILPSAVAYVAQIPWIENATIRENILFGLPYIESRYKQTLAACALQKDLEMLSDGEFTEIGASGINLSGGQRWRVSFARAVYSRAGILILDDIFSAVDAHVGKHLFKNALVGNLMQDRTRILVTHHLKLCISKAKYAVSLENGVIQHSGSVEKLIQDGILKEIIAADENEDQAVEEIIDEVNEDSDLNKGDSKPQTTPLKFVLDEERERGAVKKEIYLDYILSSGGIIFWIFIVSSFLGQEIMLLSRSYWLKMWTAEGVQASVALSPQSLIHTSLQRLMTVVQEERSLFYWIGVYSGLSVAVCIIGVAKYVLVYIASLKASKDLFERMTFTILRTPLRWLDTVPTGRILNRFNKDFELFDSKLSGNIAMLVYHSLALMGVIAAGVILSRWMLLMALVLLFINIIYAMYYLAGAREVKRLESNSRSPMFELFGSTLSGVGTIRAFGKSEEYIDKMFKKIDIFSQRTFYVWLFNRWMGLRMSAIGGFFSVIVGAVIVAVPNIDASLAGFALSFALTYTINVIWTIRRYANTELDMNSTERIIEYTRLATEDIDGIAPPAAWPQEGRVEFQDLVVSYAPELPPVLKGISFDIKPRERVGVVGRTGAGKSSMTLALFQFIRASSGSIYIDGLDISKISLQDLRSRLAIIPQDPVLFSGTIRSNLDTFEEHSDQELRDALERVHLVRSSSSGTATPNSLGSTNANIFESLDSKISEGGLNLSQGQRQLLCLARAIVSRPKILVLDEATSAVDMQTDALIQRSIREEFTDCTTLVIAHRLQTVADYDRILVLGDGKVIEYDSPWNLLQSNGMFHDMAQQSGDFDTLVSISKKAAGRE